MIRLILFLLLIPCSLGAAYFESNPIGQMLQPKDGLDGEGWEGESEDGRTVIYEDGVIMRERVEECRARAIEARQRAIVEQRRDRDLTLNETAKLRMEQRKIEKTIEVILGEIKEICYE